MENKIPCLESQIYDDNVTNGKTAERHRLESHIYNFLPLQSLAPCPFKLLMQRLATTLSKQLSSGGERGFGEALEENEPIPAALREGSSVPTFQLLPRCLRSLQMVCMQVLVTTRGGKLFACGSMDGTIAIYDSVRMKFLHHLTIWRMPMRSALFSPGYVNEQQQVQQTPSKQITRSIRSSKKSIEKGARPDVVATTTGSLTRIPRRLISSTHRIARCGVGVAVWV